ncbi:DUF58 domain-containing protein [Brucepastera parasyntrophica]|nr:DUF58 domain-containing protein [Brucepastera parasyntrophica]ULQ61167.1 DUF58 domain-containing protein [Brucepastera parasyntrophica]
MQPDRYYPEQLSVPPIPENPGKTRLPPGISGATTGKSTLKESEELYEIRPYFPGDDPRKINWKVFAHIGDISIRKGELLPPPSSEYFFLLYSPEHKKIISPGKNTAFFSRNYDLLIRRALYIALALSGQNKIVSVITEKTPARPESVSVAPDDPFADRKISEAFAAPSFRGNNMDLQKIPGLLPENAGLLIFFMPCADKNYNNAVLKDFAALPEKKVHLFIGPSAAMPEEETSAEKIRKIFYLSGSEDKTEKKYRLTGSHEIDRILAESGKGSMHAEKI